MMSAVTTVAVHEVQERTSEQQQERQILESVSPVLHQQKKPRNQHEAPEDPAACATAVILGMRMIGHEFLRVSSKLVAALTSIIWRRIAGCATYNSAHGTRNALAQRNQM
jgi:hypothetical protein